MLAGIKRTSLLCQSRNTAVQSFIALAQVDAFPMMSVKAVLILSGASCIKLLIKKQEPYLQRFIFFVNLWVR